MISMNADLSSIKGDVPYTITYSSLCSSAETAWAIDLKLRLLFGIDLVSTIVFYISACTARFISNDSAFAYVLLSLLSSLC
ncbi:hypothetical protein GJ496_009199 [Pomphorhynchus laevis]|nr:hypothetical protein GJ496_009199 [Pomphorhynchus laevis]